MPRFAAVMIFAGAVIVSTHILAPAEPPPAQPRMQAAELALIDQAKPAVEAVDEQVNRLRQRLAAPPAYPAPSRDPFRFGTRPEPNRPKPAAPPPPIVVPPPAPVLPRLVAIASTAADGGLLRTAVLAVGDDVQIVKPGETISRLIVRSIGVDVVELVDPISGATFRISLQ